jgi:hypothetical protein
VWHLLDRRLADYPKAANVEELKAQVVDCWENKISQEELNNFVRNFKARVKECRAAQGGVV